MKERYRSFDIVRGIAMISIVLGHLSEPAINKVVFTYHIPVFFLLSGYLLDNRRTIGQFFVRKIRTLIVPYIFSCFLVICSAVVMNLLVFDGVDTKSEIRKWFFAALYGAGDSYNEPFHIDNIGALWFLLATFWGVIILRLLLKCKWQIRLSAVIVLFAAGILTQKYCFWFPLSIQAGWCAVLFMYIGYLVRQLVDAGTLSRIKPEVRYAGLCFALVVWISFMRNFQTFWLVHNDFGRGFIDIAASLCGCAVIFFIAKMIDRYTRFLSKGLAYLGRFSIIFLTAHIIELDTFPWYLFATHVLGETFSNGAFLIFRIVFKFAWILLFTIILSKIKIVRRLYGLKD